MTALSTDELARSASWWGRSRDFLILVMLGAFAVTQPLLSDFRAGAGYFVARRNGPLEIILLVIVLTVVPGLVASLVVWVVGKISGRARPVAQAAFVGLFSALIAHTALLRMSSIDWRWVMVVSVVIGAVVAVIYHRATWLRQFLTYLIPAPLIFALFFLVTPPLSGLIFPGDPTAAAAEVSSDSPVVFVILDEFSVVSLLDENGEIDKARYPNFASLASMSTWYKYTAAAFDNTFLAVPALLSGRMPEASLLPTTSNYPGNLFTLLGRSHDLEVIEPFTSLCPPALCESAPPPPLSNRLGRLLVDSARLYSMMLTPDPTSSASVSDPFNEFMEVETMDRVREQAETDQVGRFNEFLNGISAGTTKLNFVHLFLPHAPFRYYPSGLQYNDGSDLAGQESEVWVDPVLAGQAQQRFLLQVQWVDQLIGDLLARLEEEEVLDEAVVVVTADHGISFQLDTPRRAITPDNAYDVGLVPLFIKGPHQKEGAVETTPARTIDILPTIADHLGLDLPWAYDGQSLLADDAEAPPLAVHDRYGSEVLLENPESGLAEATHRIESLFGTEGRGFDLYSFGGYNSLLGTEPSASSGQSSGLTARVDELWRLDHAAPSSGFVPGFLHGYLEGNADEHLHIAVSMNGKVRTVVPTFVVDDETRFNAIVPDDAYLLGFNDLELLAVTGPTDQPKVRAVDLPGNDGFEMETDSSGQAVRLVDSEGGSWPVNDSSSLTGNVDAAVWRESGFQLTSPPDLHLSGWAIDEAPLIPVEQIVLFVEGEFAGSAAIDVERTDVETLYESPGVRMSGFQARLSHLAGGDSSEIRVFAIGGDEAAEIPLSPPVMAAISAG
jgi:hypothetical protein